MNFFQFFGMAERFFLDEGILRKAFYANSKKYHPDFYTLEPEARQAEVLELSTLNNEAWKTLSDFDNRMKYILELHGLWAEENQQTLPTAFLAEMMELNEAIMELEFDNNPAQYLQIRDQLEALEKNLWDGIVPELEAFKGEQPDMGILQRVKDYFLKKRYLLRIKETLSNFAPL
jgi:molecular chaperone HscB